MENLRFFVQGDGGMFYMGNRGDVGPEPLDPETIEPGDTHLYYDGVTWSLRGPLHADDINAAGLTVQTLNIAGNAVTVPYVASWSGSQSGTETGWIDLLAGSIVLTSSGQLLVTATVNQDFFGNEHWWYYRLYVDGEYSPEVGGTWVGQSVIPLAHSKLCTAGTKSIKVQFYAQGGNVVTARSALIVAQGAYR